MDEYRGIAAHGFAPDPGNAGWLRRPAIAVGLFSDLFGAISVRVEGPATARLRVMPQPDHRNLLGGLHGGYILALIDQALFVGPATLGIANAFGGVTVDLATQFFAPLRVEAAIDVVVEILRETGRMIFTRGLVEQDGMAAVAFSGTTRKGRPA